MTARLFSLIVQRELTPEQQAGWGEQERRSLAAQPLRFRGVPHLVIDNGPTRARLRQRLALIQLSGRAYR